MHAYNIPTHIAARTWIQIIHLFLAYISMDERLKPVCEFSKYPRNIFNNGCEFQLVWMSGNKCSHENWFEKFKRAEKCSIIADGARWLSINFDWKIPLKLYVEMRPVKEGQSNKLLFTVQSSVRAYFYL
jgi:hypothetical protein